jgi:hypothetical protein
LLAAFKRSFHICAVVKNFRSLKYPTMKKPFTLAVIFLLIVQSVSAQAPQYIPWQAVVRDTSWNPLPNQLVSFRFTVHTGSSSGTTVYQETDTATTNKLGMVNLEIGSGVVVSGTFSGINWSSGSKYLQVELDPTGGSSYTNMGTPQMMSVPYSLYSGGSAGTAQPTGQVMYGTGTGITSDALFTRNSTTYATQIFKTASGGINEGFSIGPAVGGLLPDGPFITRIDTPENHYDFIGMGNFSALGAVPNGIGLVCVSGFTGHGPMATILIADSNPINTTINISASNSLTTAYKAKGTISPTGISLGVTSSSSTGATVSMDTVTVHFKVAALTYNWPTSGPPTPTMAGNLLASDQYGNMSWVAVSSLPLTGPTGATGATGAVGATGSAGTNGSNGVTGATGATGAGGTNGTNGATGATGAAGTNGSNGTNGATGATGAAGTNGVTGATGSAGTNGSDGSNGATGATGAQGPTGVLSSGSTAGNTPYWNGSSWVVNSSNIYNNGGNIGIGTPTPNSTLQDSGSVSFKLTVHTANYTVSATDHFVICTTNSFTVTLPTAVGITGREYIIKGGTTSKTITLATTSSQTIDGAAPGSISGFGVTRLVSNGANWLTW